MKTTSILIFILLSLPSLGLSAELPRRGFLGLGVALLPPEMQQQLNIPPGQGVIVKRVLPGASAEAAGIVENDVLWKINGTVLTGPDQFPLVVARFRGGDTLNISMFHLGTPISKTIALKSYPIESSPDFNILYSSVEVDGFRRRVIITQPKTPSQFPAILMVGGIGCYTFDRPLDDNDRYRQILYALTKHGYVTMRVDKSGMGDSEGVPCAESDFDSEIRGYAAGLQVLKNYDFVDSKNIFIFGHSMGGIIAPILAREQSVRGLMVSETVAISWFEYELENARRQGVLAGMEPDLLDRSMRLKELCMHKLLIEKQTPAEILATHSECAEDIQYPASYKYMQQVADLNLPALWKATNIPTLAIYGKADFVTSEKENRFISETVNKAHPGFGTFELISDMDHYLTTVSSMEESYERNQSGQYAPLNSTIINVLSRWMSSVRSGSNGLD